MHRHLIGVLGLAAATGCGNGTGPSGQLPVSFVAFETVAAGTALPVTAEGRNQAIVLTGGPGLSCGVSNATAVAERTAKGIHIEFRFTPMDSCPFAPVDVAYTAIVEGVRNGRYRLTVAQRYWSDQPATELYDDSLTVP